MKPKSADRFLASPPEEVRAVLFFGPDEGQVRERARALAKKLGVDLADPFAVSELTPAAIAADPASLYDDMAAHSLMGGRRLVRVRDAGDGTTPAIQAVLGALPPGDTVLMVEAGELSSTSKLRKLFESPSLTVAAALACYEAENRDLVAMATETLRQAGVSATREALDLLADLVARDRAVARGEMEKLVLYAGTTNTPLTYEDVAAAIGDSATLEMDAPAWATAGGALDELDRALARLFADGQSPVAVIRATQRHFTRLYEVAGSRSPVDVAMKALRPPVFWKDEARFRQQSALWTRDGLEDALARLVFAEADCKRTGLRDTTICSRALMGLAGLAARQGGAKTNRLSH